MGKPLIWKFVDWGLKRDGVIGRGRARRMAAFLEKVKPPAKARIIDFGGTESLWKLFDHDFHITLVNLTDNHLKMSEADTRRFSFVKGDACDLSGQYPDGAFDIVFSNSCIEHVGDDAHQAAFAREVRRLAPAYWVQTPSSRCPLEAHTLVPFYWKLPGFARRILLNRWKRKHPHLWELIASTRMLKRKRMIELFPDAQVFVERRMGLEKSYACYRSCQSATDTPRAQ